ncbi:GntR family transcriptional regulator [Streptomyces sp. TRM72054]|uniref:GntR family transcriptional regulator n=1 Tax=Streptomyces sp. TRM72054 TaxID=2870562 RepID=UPI001C8B2749|nr:GntR family transcriptional regulator [Streptomyces sp. TRM72054]MBX9392250.1 GntR family transcriptional regulator [Streptomyces sp. TRM72054]
MSVANDRITAPAARPGQTALYQFCDDADRLLYVGITSDPKTRWARHRRYAATTWWTLATHVSVDWFAERDAAATAELRVIRTQAPLYNSGGSPSPFRDQAPEETPCPMTNMQRFREATGGGFQPPGRPWRNMDQAVAETLARDMAAGRMRCGDQLPRVAELVNRFGVSADTVHRALRRLVAAGRIERQGVGSGTRYFVIPL